MKDIFWRDFLTKPIIWGDDLGASQYPQIFVILKCYLVNIQQPQLCIAERWDNLEHSKQLRKLHDDNQIVEIWALFLSDIMKSERLHKGLEVTLKGGRDTICWGQSKLFLKSKRHIIHLYGY